MGAICKFFSEILLDIILTRKIDVLYVSVKPFLTGRTLRKMASMATKKSLSSNLLF